MKLGQKMRILKDRRTETVVCPTFFSGCSQTSDFSNCIWKLYIEFSVPRIFVKDICTCVSSYKYNFSANFSRIFQRIQLRDIELNKSWDFDAVQSDVEIIFCSDLQREFGWFWQFCEYRIPNVKRVIFMNVRSPMDRTKNRFRHRPVYPFKALAISSNLIKELSLAVHSTPVTEESSKLRIYFA